MDDENPHRSFSRRLTPSELIGRVLKLIATDKSVTLKMSLRLLEQ